MAGLARADARGRAARRSTAGTRLDEALRGFLAEQGTKHIAKRGAVAPGRRHAAPAADRPRDRRPAPAAPPTGAARDALERPRRRARRLLRPARRAGRPPARHGDPVRCRRPLGPAQIVDGRVALARGDLAARAPRPPGRQHARARLSRRPPGCRSAPGRGGAERHGCAARSRRRARVVRAVPWIGAIACPTACETYSAARRATSRGPWWQAPARP